MNFIVIIKIITIAKNINESYRWQQRQQKKADSKEIKILSPKELSEFERRIKFLEEYGNLQLYFALIPLKDLDFSELKKIYDENYEKTKEDRFSLYIRYLNEL